MEVVLLGTGGPRGWPERACPCASCATAVALRTARAPTAVLVDDVLLLDGTDATPLAAARAGRSLASVRRVLLSGPTTDAAALAASGEVVSAAAGERVPADGHVLRALGHGAGLAWDVTAPDGARLLYAPGGGPLVDLPREPYDVVLLGAAALPELLVALRGSGAVTAATQVVAIGIGHDDGMPDALEARLLAWGALALPDGTTLPGAAPAREQAGTGRTLVLGGARSGKSALAEQLLAACPDVTYVATGGIRDGDAEWRARVAAHVARRPSTWTTVETTDVAGCLRDARGPLLVDCLGTWLTARLDARGVWEGVPASAVDGDLDELVEAWRATRVRVVAVSNEVGSGVVPATASGRLFRDLLGRLNTRIAAESETVLLSVAGIAVPLREHPRR